MGLDEILEIAREEGGSTKEIKDAICRADIETLKEWKKGIEDAILDIQARCEESSNYIYYIHPEERLHLVDTWAEYDEVLKTVKSMIRHGNTGSDSPQMPEDFKTEKAKLILEKAVDKKLMTIDGGRYVWIRTPSLFGYFVEKVSDKLGIRPSNERIPWGKFGFITLKKGKLITARMAVRDYTQKGFSPPEGDDIINEILKEVS